jgi:hypothetical protein
LKMLELQSLAALSLSSGPATLGVVMAFTQSPVDQGHASGAAGQKFLFLNDDYVLEVPVCKVLAECNAVWPGQFGTGQSTISSGGKLHW